MNQRIAIEPNLTPIKEYLSRRGYNVDQISFNELAPAEGNNYAAFIVSGMNTDFMGMNDTNSKTVVIDVKGMTPEQVYDQLKSQIQ
ncbi:MAG: YkuS family protein [Acetivibrionales bacterium]|jgi:hypothetical protein